MFSFLTSFIPSLVNWFSQQDTNSQNRAFYDASQQRANNFARSERLSAQEYNSPLNQLSLMQQAGMNPNLLSGTSFQATSPVPNQSVSPPQNVAPQFNPQYDIAQELKSDVEVKNLRKDLLMKDLDLQDRSAQVKAHLMELVSDASDAFVLDDNGNLNFSAVVYNERARNHYERQELHERDMQYMERYAKYLDNDVKSAVAPILKKIPKSQWDSLLQDIKSKKLENALKQNDVDMLRKYGISPHDANEWQTLLRMILRNPDAVEQVISAFQRAGVSTLRSIFGNDVSKFFSPGTSSNGVSSW